MWTDNLHITGLIQLVFMFVGTAAYPSGAPGDACSRMSPKKGHGGSSQTIPCPYTISMSSTSYYPGQIITVTVNGSDTFKGVILQARRANTSKFIYGNPEGTFDRLQETLQYLTCNNVSNSTVTHINNTEKQQIQVDWIAPQDYIGKIKFYATIVQNISTYWLKEKSHALVEEHTETTQQSSTTEITYRTTISGDSTVSPSANDDDEDGDSNEELPESSTPTDFRNATLVTVVVTDSLLNNTTPTVLPPEATLPQTVDDTFSMKTTIVTDNVTSPNFITISSSDSSPEVSSESATFDYSVESNITTYPYQRNQSHVTSTHGVTDDVMETSSDVNTMMSTTEDHSVGTTGNTNVPTNPLNSTTWNMEITDDITLSTQTIKPTVSEFSETTDNTIMSTTEDHSVGTTGNTNVPTNPLNSTTGNMKITDDITLSTQTIKPTDYAFSETTDSLTGHDITERSTFSLVTNETEITTVDFDTTEFDTTAFKATVDPLEDSITDLVTETNTTNYNLTGNYSLTTKTTIDHAIESHTGKPISMVTDLIDTYVVFKMTITSIEFTDSLTDRSTDEFKDLEDGIQKTMEDIYSTWEGFKECNVVDFTRGSVVSETELIFETSLSEDDKAGTVGELYTLVEENGGIGNYTVSDLQAVSSEGTYISVDPCYLLPCPLDLHCYVEDSKCILTCKENLHFCPNGECTLDDGGKNLICSNTTVKVEPTNNDDSKELVIAMVLIGASVFLIILVIIVFVFICKSWRKRRRRWRRRRQNQDIQLFGFEDNKHIRLNGGVPVASISARGRYFVEIDDAPNNDTPFFSSHPTELNLSGRGSIGSLSQHSVFDRAFASVGQSDLEEHDYDYDVINRSRSVTFIETPQILGDDQSAEEFGIENFSFGVPKYVDREDGGGSYRVRWDFKVDDPVSADMDIAL